MIKDLLKNDIKQMLDRISIDIIDEDINKDELIKSINEQINDLELIDLFVTREYLKDQLDEIEKNEIIVGEEDESLVSDKVEKYLDENNKEITVLEDKEGKYKTIEPIEAGSSTAILSKDEDSELEKDMDSVEDSEDTDGIEDIEDTDDIEDIEDIEDTENDDSLLENINNSISKINEDKTKLVDLIDNYIKTISDFEKITEYVEKQVLINDTIEEKINELQELEIDSPDISNEVNLKVKEMESFLNTQEEEVTNMISGKKLDENPENIENINAVEEKAKDIMSSLISKDKLDDNSENEELEFEEDDNSENEELEFEEDDNSENEELEFEEVKEDLNELIESIMSISAEDENKLLSEIEEYKDEFLNKLEEKVNVKENKELEFEEDNNSENEELETKDEETKDEETKDEETKDEETKDEETKDEKAVTSSVIFDTEEEKANNVLDNSNKDAIGLKNKSQISKKTFEEDLAIVTEDVKEDIKEIKKEFKSVEANKKVRKNKKAK